MRAVLLKTVRNRHYIKRPIEKLYPLEIRYQENVSVSDIDQANDINNRNGEDEIYDSNTNSNGYSSRPQREVAGLLGTYN